MKANCLIGNGKGDIEIDVDSNYLTVVNGLLTLSPVFLASILAGLSTVGIMMFFANALPASGWLLTDNKTIGKTGSGADYSGDEYKALYDYLTNLYGGTYDWSGGSVINLPDTRGISFYGAGTTDRTLGKNAAGNFSKLSFRSVTRFCY